MSLAPPPPAERPETARHLFERGQERLQYGDLEGARNFLSRSLAQDATPAETHYLYGNCLRRLGLAEEAEAALRAALERDPGLQPAGFSLCFLYQETGRRREAAEQLRRMAEQYAADRDILHQVGGLMAEFGQYADAAALYEQILKSEPQARSYQRLGQYYQKLGRYQEAFEALNEAITRNPDAGAAYLLLANTRRYTRDEADTALLRKFASTVQRRDLNEATRTCLHFGLGKMHDDRGEYEEAFRHFEAGNGLRRNSREFTIAFDHARWQKFAQDIGGLASVSLAQATSAGPAGPAPVFVVGMLRSGTTLVERILASHPAVCSLGETGWVEEMRQRAFELTGSDFPANLSQLSEGQLKQLRTGYTGRWPRHALDAVYMLDKNPTNFMYLGLMARVFPDAKIVHCRRDARDSCLSVYFQNFAHPYINYAYDLEEIGHYYNGYAEVMRHFKRLLPPGMLHEVGYEDLIADQEKTTRGLLEALGLPWDPRCLQFHAQRDTIATASLWQARQPLYKESVGRWRHYERHLAPLLKTLRSD